MLKVNRYSKNPILKPDTSNEWEAEAVLNGCPIKFRDKIFLTYRAISIPHYHSTTDIEMQISNIGLAESRDGFRFIKRRKLISPQEHWEIYGCEDPRVTEFEGKYYIFYTALSTYPFNAAGIKIGLAITKDFQTIQEKHLITPFNAKAMAMFPERINGKIYSILTANTDMPPSKIAIASFDRINQMWSQDYWLSWYKDLKSHSIDLQRSPSDQIELGAPPIKTPVGWLVIYSYIKNYFSDNKLFGIEAALLGLNDPRKIIASTDMPLMVPEEIYERYGIIPNIIFPSGALALGNELRIYYGAADTVIACASTKFGHLLQHILTDVKEEKLSFIRSKNNPIISPKPESSWESRAAFNPAAVYENNKVHIVYRAMSEDNTSVMGYANSDDGMNISYRSPDPIYTPRNDFEMKKVPGGNSGCEDPRITKIDDRFYMFYTAYNGAEPPRVAVTSIAVADFISQKWNWSASKLISPSGMADKDACIFPEKVNGQYLIFHRIGDDIDIAFVPDLKFEATGWLEERRWLLLRKGFWDSKKLGISAPPMKVSSGWIMLYHGVSDDNIYRVGAILLDKNDPTNIIGRTTNFIFEPQTEYEKVGQFPNVVFPCGSVIIKDTIYMYYGGGDSVVGVATMKVKTLLNLLD